jgi:hypothetical protein
MPGPGPGPAPGPGPGPGPGPQNLPPVEPPTTTTPVGTTPG